MPHFVSVRFAGERACFTDPARKGERASYPIMTPSAAIGALENVYWHPGVMYSVQEIIVEKVPKSFQVTMNEVEKPGRSQYQDPCAPGMRIQRVSEILHDVSYVVRYKINTTADYDGPMKAEEILLRRLAQRQFFRPPSLGRSQFPAETVDLVEDLSDAWPLSSKHNTDFGTMFLGYVRVGSVVTDRLFFNAVMRSGRVKVPTRESILALRPSSLAA